MKQITRKRLSLFQKYAPIGPFGLVGAGENRPIDEPNVLRRVDKKSLSPKSSYIEVEVPVVKHRPLRWYTPEHYARWGGMYYHKRDKKFYPVVDTNHKNQYRRYMFIKTFTRRKRFYGSQSRTEAKPYSRLVIDLVDALTFEHSEDRNNIPVVVSRGNKKIWDERWRSILALLDRLDPLYKDSSYRSVTTDSGILLSDVWRPSSLKDIDDSTFDYLDCATRVDAFDRHQTSGTYRIQDDNGNFIESYVDLPVWFRTEVLPLTLEKEMLIRDEVMENHDEAILALAEQWFSTTAVKQYVGITGPGLIESTVPYLFLEADNFSIESGNDLLDSVPYTELCALVGYSKFKNSPIRGTAQLLQFFGEMPETVKTFASIFDTCLRACMHLKRGDIHSAIKQFEIGKKYLTDRSVKLLDLGKAAASLDLLYKFGIKPFLEDLKAIADLGQVFGQTTFEGVKRRHRINWSDTPWAEKIIDSTFTVPFNVVHGSDRIRGQSVINLRFTCDCEYGAIIKVKDPISFFFEATGLNSILGTAWELLPLTFIIDWFVDVGSVIRYLTDVNLDSYELVNGYRTVVSKGVVTEQVTVTHVNDHEVSFSGRNTYTIAEIFRGLYDPRVDISVDKVNLNLPLHDIFIALSLYQPLQRGNISISKIGTLAEIILQRVRS